MCVTKPKDKRYGVAWTIIVDALVRHGIAHWESTVIADDIVAGLTECEPSAFLSEDPRDYQESLPRQITFRAVTASGQMRIAEFLRVDKVHDLMADPGSLGEFLRDFVSKDLEAGE